MKVFLFFDFENGLFLPYLSSELDWEVVIRCVDLLTAIDVPFRGFNSSDPLQPLKAQKCDCLVYKFVV